MYADTRYLFFSSVSNYARFFQHPFFGRKRVQKYTLFLNYQNIFSHFFKKKSQFVVFQMSKLLKKLVLHISTRRREYGNPPTRAAETCLFPTTSGNTGVDIIASCSKSPI